MLQSMRGLLRNRRLLIAILVVVLIIVAYRWRKNGFEGIFSPVTGNEPTETVFIQAAKQFALTVPAKWNVTEPVSGRQTLVYPAGTQMSNSDIPTLLTKDVVVVETAVNKKDSFDTLISTIKAAAEKSGSTVTVEPKDFGSLKASQMKVSGKTNYQQIFFNTPTVIILTAKIDHAIINDLAKTVTIDLSGYASDIAQASNLTRTTNQDIAAGRFSDIYKASTDNLRKAKGEEEFATSLQSVGPDFNNTVLIWGVFINKKGLGVALNIINQDKIIRRASFYYAKSKDSYALDAMRISGEIKPAEKK